MPRLRDAEAISPGMVAVLTVSLAILFVPLFIIILLSFNISPYGTLPFQGTLKWYGALFRNSGLLAPTWLSLQLSFVVAISASVFGTTAAVWLEKRATRLGATILKVALLSAITVPWLILGLAMLLVMNAIGLGRGLFSMYLGLLATTLPYVVFIVAARLRALDPDLDHAARSLGASAFVTFIRVSAPLILPAILSGTLISFMVSFNNFLIQYFLAPFGVQTLPLKIYTLIRVGYLPDLNALATVIVAATCVIILLLHRLGLRNSGLPGGG
ncbi:MULTISPECIES: ABC transporter permease [unclassified Acidisoma]|uniref:ABC transporter permease n=1 Tax=unclassified Acidisoma TaxID=2634065 RepID=UPI00131CEDA3|nr:MULTISPECIES: ABC transporter permease [unclassified Acidisoma]